MSSDLPQMAAASMARTGYSQSQGSLAYDAYRAHLLGCEPYLEANAFVRGTLLPDFTALTTYEKAAWETVARIMTQDLRDKLRICHDVVIELHAKLAKLENEADTRG